MDHADDQWPPIQDEQWGRAAPVRESGQGRDASPIFQAGLPCDHRQRAVGTSGAMSPAWADASPRGQGWTHNDVSDASAPV